jgi:hypothetical protein
MAMSSEYLITRVQSGQRRTVEGIEVQVARQRRHHVLGAMGKLCFDVTLSYRRLELPRRIPARE